MLNISYQPPEFTEQDAQHFALQYYGVHASAHMLPGEQDLNVRLESSAGETFVLKIAHAGEALDVLDFQNKTLEHLAVHAPSLLVPRVQRTTEGETIASIRHKDQTSYAMRLLSYVPGNVLARTAPHTPELLYHLG